MNKTTDKDMKALDASMESLKNKAGVEHLKRPFTAGLVYIPRPELRCRP